MPFKIEGTEKEPNVSQMEGGDSLRQEVNNLLCFLCFELFLFLVQRLIS